MEKKPRKPAVKKEPTKDTESFDFKEGVNYEIEGSGKYEHLKKGCKYEVDGLMAKLLAKKGAIIYKG